jgi:hypothetical protein
MERNAEPWPDVPDVASWESDNRLPRSNRGRRGAGHALLWLSGPWRSAWEKAWVDPLGQKQLRQVFVGSSLLVRTLRRGPQLAPAECHSGLLANASSTCSSIFRLSHLPPAPWPPFGPLLLFVSWRPCCRQGLL